MREVRTRAHPSNHRLSHRHLVRRDERMVLLAALIGAFGVAVTAAALFHDWLVTLLFAAIGYLCLVGMLAPTILSAPFKQR